VSDIIISGYADSQSIAHDAGGVAILHKPFTLAQMREAISRQMSNYTITQSESDNAQGNDGGRPARNDGRSGFGLRRLAAEQAAAPVRSRRCAAG